MTTTTSNYGWSKPDPGGSANTWGAILNGATDAIDTQVFKNTQGVTDGSDASAGQVGEVISSLITSGVPLAANTATNVTSIALTAGDWDVGGEVTVTPSAAGSTGHFAGIGNVSATFPALSLATSRFSITGYATTAIGACALPLRTCRVNLTAPTTYYLVGQNNGQSATAGGAIWARRAR